MLSCCIIYENIFAFEYLLSFVSQFHILHTLQGIPVVYVSILSCLADMKGFLVIKGSGCQYAEVSHNVFLLYGQATISSPI